MNTLLKNFFYAFTVMTFGFTQPLSADVLIDPFLGEIESDKVHTADYDGTFIDFGTPPFEQDEDGEVIGVFDNQFRFLEVEGSQIGAFVFPLASLIVDSQFGAGEASATVGWTASLGADLTDYRSLEVEIGDTLNGDWEVTLGLKDIANDDTSLSLTALSTGSVLSFDLGAITDEDFVLASVFEASLTFTNDKSTATDSRIHIERVWVTPVPEPSTYSIIGGLLGGILFLRRKLAVS